MWGAEPDLSRRLSDGPDWSAAAAVAHLLPGYADPSGFLPSFAGGHLGPAPGSVLHHHHQQQLHQAFQQFKNDSLGWPGGAWPPLGVPPSPSSAAAQFPPSSTAAQFPPSSTAAQFPPSSAAAHLFAGADIPVDPMPPPPPPPQQAAVPPSPRSWRGASDAGGGSGTSAGTGAPAGSGTGAGGTMQQRLVTSTPKWFKLMQQPNDRQRKSYKNENRYILPNPLTVCLARPPEQSGLAAVSDGTVACRLVCENGDELGDGKRDCLSGGQRKPLDPERKCMFCLKILETSEGNKFRLLFSVQFTAGSTHYEENLLSHPFKVTSNKKKSGVERPVIHALNPSVGLSSEETEVWIKGEFFADRASIVVKFGDDEARLTETEDNLVCAYAPPRKDLTQNTQVPVTVTNLYSAQPSLTSEGALAFTYVFVADNDQQFGPAPKHEPTPPPNPKRARVH
eukprot:TRINITY_DN141_c0_g2_i3.p1 TRINITY_DN141_c0_g2~~TRINITY_DN141_c0_g2_i3.p1  ORF type:complete len:451 (+),score=143.04 TRINITY_DN141_c0_g2_i3:573-1925(+)